MGLVMVWLVLRWLHPGENNVESSSGIEGFICLCRELYVRREHCCCLKVRIGEHASKGRYSDGVAQHA
jgi:hypothetical protein